jgi:AraC-like DNA-binding protein
MSYWDYKRSPASARLLLDFGLERGLTAPQVLAGTQLSLRQLGDANAEISAAQELRIIANLIRLTHNEPWLGMEVGWRYSFSVYGFWGYGLISSATVGDAVSLAMRYVPLTFAFADITLQADKQLVTMHFVGPELARASQEFVVERDMIATCVLLRELVGPDFEVTTFKLTHRTRRTTPTFNRVKTFLGQTPKLGAEANVIQFDSAYLSRVLPQANPITAAMCEQMCEQLLQRRSAHVATATSVSHYLSVLPANQVPSLTEIARLKNTSARTLKRKLQSEGTSYRHLVAESRKEVAGEMLGDATLTITQVAERLGFSDLSTFSQAFKRWYGVSPRAFRRQNPAAPEA